jgi:hypothetical protein
MAEQLVCPLCKQPVSKSVYDKITGIWVEKQKLETKFKERIVALKTEKTNLKMLYLQREKKIRDKSKSLAALEVKRKTKSLNDKIGKISKELIENNRKAEQKIHQAIHSAELREKRKYVQQVSQIKRDLSKSAKAELNLKIKERELRLRRQLEQKEAKKSQASQKKINNLQKERELAIRRTVSLTKTTVEQQKKIEDLNNQLKKQTTPQVEGLLYEDKLLEALHNEFPDDKFQHTGKGGDIIQSVIYKNNPVGTIVYECKKVLKFTSSHIAQTAKAKTQRAADFAILVTNATKKGYSGFTIEKGVIIIHPAGVLSIAKLLRERIIQIANLNLSKTQKNKVIQEMVEYMESAQFKNSLENIIQIVKEECKDLQDEVKEHCKRWIKKRDAYFNIFKEIADVKQKTLDAITGEKTKSQLPLKFTLSLPEVKEE